MTASIMIVLVAAMCILQAVMASMPSLRIVGGKPADKNQFPYQVSIRDSRNINNFNHLCAGVLIGYSEVLTAAHCVSTVPLQNLYIVTGTTSLSLANPGYIMTKASYVKVHEFFKPNGYSYNIAFIRLSTKLPENRVDIRPATLLTDLPNEGANCTVSGWGDTNGTSYSPTIPTDLRFAYVPYVSNAECRKSYAYVQADSVCSATSGIIAGPCGKLDSGDPLHCAGGLLGLFSWSEGCGPRYIPSVYTSIPFHLYWISEMMHGTPTVKPSAAPTIIPTTVKPMTTPTTKPTTKPTTTAPPTSPTTKAPTSPTIRPTPKPNGSHLNSVDLFVVFLALLLLVILS